MREDEFLDEVCRVLHETEKAIKSKVLQEEYFFSKSKNNSDLTVRDIF